MSRIRAMGRRSVVVTLAAVGLIGLLTAVGIASLGSPDEIVFVNNSNGSMSIHLGGYTQTIPSSGPGCKKVPIGDPVLQITPTGYTNQLGLVEDGLGSSENRGGNAQNCGRVNYLGGTPVTETLSFKLGTSATNRAIKFTQWDFEAKFDTQMLFTFYANGNPVGSVTWNPGDTSDEGPDSKFNDKYRLYTWVANGTGHFGTDAPAASTPFVLFDEVKISMMSGGVAVEGGADWQYSTEPVDEHRTVFYLADLTPSVAIDKQTNGFQGSTPGSPLFIPVVHPDDEEVPTEVTWTYDVTNTGNVSLDNVVVTDDQGVEVEPPTEDGNGTLDPGETWTYQASGAAVPGSYDPSSPDPFAPYLGYSNTGSVTANSVLDPNATVTESDNSGYYGSDPSIEIEVTSPGVVTFPDDVGWTFLITNTGNVPLGTVLVSEDGTPLTGCVLDPGPSETALPDCTIRELVPSENVTVGYSEPADPLDTSTEFTVEGQDPIGTTTSDGSGPVEYVFNYPPVAVDDFYETNERAAADPESALTFTVPFDGVLGVLDRGDPTNADPDSDSDVDSDPLTVGPNMIETTMGGEITLNPGGGFDYTPLLLDDSGWAPWEQADGSFSYTDTWEYTLSDGRGGTATGLVSIEVQRVVCSREKVGDTDTVLGFAFGEFTLLPDEFGVVACKPYGVVANAADQEVTLTVPPPGPGVPPVNFSGILRGNAEEIDAGGIGELTIGLAYDPFGTGFRPLLECDGDPVFDRKDTIDDVTDDVVVFAEIPIGETWCLAGISVQVEDGELISYHFVYGEEDPGFKFR
ncbi:MAG: hypothetical protein WBM90_00080 [Acidimicrobiia bacterium]